MQSTLTGHYVFHMSNIVQLYGGSRRACFLPAFAAIPCADLGIVDPVELVAMHDTKQQSDTAEPVGASNSSSNGSSVSSNGDDTPQKTNSSSGGGGDVDGDGAMTKKGAEWGLLQLDLSFAWRMEDKPVEDVEQMLQEATAQAPAVAR